MVLNSITKCLIEFRFLATGLRNSLSFIAGSLVQMILYVPNCLASKTETLSSQQSWFETHAKGGAHQHSSISCNTCSIFYSFTGWLHSENIPCHILLTTMKMLFALHDTRNTRYKNKFQLHRVTVHISLGHAPFITEKIIFSTPEIWQETGLDWHTFPPPSHLRHMKCIRWYLLCGPNEFLLQISEIFTHCVSYFFETCKIAFNFSNRSFCHRSS